MWTPSSNLSGFWVRFAIQGRLNARAFLIRWIARDPKEGVLILILLILNITPSKVGVCHVFPSETLCVDVQDTHHFRSPPEEGQNFCPPFKHQFSKSRPIWVWAHNFQESLWTHNTTSEPAVFLPMHFYVKFSRMHFWGSFSCRHI